ncbi:zona pellucida sperm-binding protein 3-like, partial [Polypterus senegalus]|uniref:zona pellucida sperm-binding protein 3-like n=1 Tax=Polypterus senegalus TaxID=55291 RepID=UPI0019646C88
LPARQHNVSSNALNPTWVPYTSTISAQDILGFSLIIMNSKAFMLHLTNSNSQFITPRVAPSTLQFVLDAFRFYGVATSSIFITCCLKVTLASQNIDSLNKACSYVTGQSQ